MINHAGSNQFRHIEPGDVLWFVTVRTGKLVLVGRLIVGERTDWEGAMRRLDKQVAEKSRFLALAEPGTETYMQEISLEEITESLRFESDCNDRLTLVNGVLNPQQMQMKRRLTYQSSLLIGAKWSIDSTHDWKTEPRDK